MKRLTLIIACLLLLLSSSTLIAEESAVEEKKFKEEGIVLLIPSDYLILDKPLLSEDDIFSLKLQGFRNEQLLSRMTVPALIQGIDLKNEVLWRVTVSESRLWDYYSSDDTKKEQLLQLLKDEVNSYDYLIRQAGWYYHPDASFTRVFAENSQGGVSLIWYQTASKFRKIEIFLVTADRSFTDEDIRKFEDMLDASTFIYGLEPSYPPLEPIERPVNPSSPSISRGTWLIIVFIAFIVSIKLILSSPKKTPNTPAPSRPVASAPKKAPDSELHRPVTATKTVICPGCGASCLIKAGALNKCEYCNRHLE